MIDSRLFSLEILYCPLVMYLLKGFACPFILILEICILIGIKNYEFNSSEMKRSEYKHVCCKLVETCSLRLKWKILNYVIINFVTELM